MDFINGAIRTNDRGQARGVKLCKISEYELSQIQARIKRCRIYTGITANVVARLVAKRSGTLCNQDHMQTAGPMSAFLNGRGPISEQRLGIDGDGLVGRLHRVFAIDLSRCPRCGGSSQVIAAITDPGVIARILEHIGLDGRARPRAPPQALAS